MSGRSINKRELRGRGGGRSSGRSSYRSSYSSKSSSARVSPSYRYSYSTKKTPSTKYNSYWDGKRTYSPLYKYYRPSGFYNARGYYSTTFLLVYYNGYGYNFYYGGYGYYEYSVHPEDTSTRDTIVTLVIVCCCVCCCIFFCYRCNKDRKDADSDSDVDLSEMSGIEDGRGEDDHENRPYNPNEAAYPPGFNQNVPPPQLPPPSLPPDVQGYTMDGAVLGVPVGPPQPFMQQQMAQPDYNQVEYPNVLQSQ